MEINPPFGLDTTARHPAPREKFECPRVRIRDPTHIALRIIDGILLGCSLIRLGNFPSIEFFTEVRSFLFSTKTKTKIAFPKTIYVRRRAHKILESPNGLKFDCNAIQLSG